jgi:hypothetical protein
VLHVLGECAVWNEPEVDHPCAPGGRPLPPALRLGARPAPNTTPVFPIDAADIVHAQPLHCAQSLAVTAAPPAELRRPVPIRTWAGPPAPEGRRPAPAARSEPHVHRDQHIRGRVPVDRTDSDIRSRLVQTVNGSTQRVNASTRFVADSRVVINQVGQCLRRPETQTAPDKSDTRSPHATLKPQAGPKCTRAAQ